MGTATKISVVFLLFVVIVSLLIVGLYFYGREAKCGISRESYRIYSDRDTEAEAEADKQSWPWIVMITVDYLNGTKEICTGTLIGSQWVLAAAHCFSNKVPHEIKIGLGSKTMKKMSFYDVQFTFTVSDFNSRSEKNDYSLLKMSDPISFLDRIHSWPICVTSDMRIVQDEYLVGAGFGMTFLEAMVDEIMPDFDYPDEYDPQMALMERPIEKVEGHLCGNLEDKSTDFTCVTSPGEGVTVYDNGGPLMTLKGKRWFMVGIMSHGGYFRQNGSGAVHHRNQMIYPTIGKSCKWIKQLTQREVICLPSFGILHGFSITLIGLSILPKLISEICIQ